MGFVSSSVLFHSDGCFSAAGTKSPGMNEDVITVIYFQSLLATISFHDLSTEM